MMSWVTIQLDCCSPTSDSSSIITIVLHQLRLFYTPGQTTTRRIHAKCQANDWKIRASFILSQSNRAEKGGEISCHEQMCVLADFWWSELAGSYAASGIHQDELMEVTYRACSKKVLASLSTADMHNTRCPGHGVDALL
jgi:hypothetical protein